MDNQKIIELQKKITELENILYQNQSLGNNQKKINSIYNRNIWKANETLKNKKKVFLKEI